MDIRMIRFNIPVKRDEFGGTVVKAMYVAPQVLPVMAAIIEAATHPVRVQQEFHVPTHGQWTAEEALNALRDRVKYDLTHALRNEAEKNKMTIITPIEWHESIEQGGVLFRVTASAMPLIEVKW